jgi:hypothetical protein
VANKADDTLVGATTSADADYGMLSGFFTGLSTSTPSGSRTTACATC